MEIQREFLPIIIFMISAFLTWVFSGFSDNDYEAVLSNPFTFLFSIITLISLVVSIIYYPILIIRWVYNNVTIV